MRLGKIEIVDENHLKEVVKAFESMGYTVVKHDVYNNFKSLWLNHDGFWYWSFSSIHSYENEIYKSVPEYEIIAKTSYELKEVPKIKITCKNCGKTVEYKDSNDLFKDFVIFKGTIDTGDKILSNENFNHICKDCMKKLINN